MKKNLLNSLLVTLMVLVGGSAWAQTTYFSQDYEGDGATTDWTTATGGRFTPAILEESGNHFLSVDQSTRNNNGTTITSTATQGKVDANTPFTMTFDMRLSSSSNQTATQFTIYDAANSGTLFSLKETGTWATTWILNGVTSNTVTLPNSNKASGSNTIADVTWCSYKISYTESGITYLTIINKETEDVIFERAIVGGGNSTGGLGKMTFVTSRYLANFAIDNVVVREIQDGDVPVATPTTYTIKFVDESSNTIKEDAVINTVVGLEITAAADYLASIYANDKKYIYKSGNNAITTVEAGESNVITLVFREAAIWNFTVNATGEESAIIKEIAKGTAFEADAVTVPYPMYVNVEGTLWTKAATNKEYRTTVTLTQDNTVANLAYTATDIANVIYLSEGEDIEGTTIFNGSNADIRSSNAAAGWSTKKINLTTLPVGKYNINGVIIANSGTPVISFAIGNREVLAITATNSNWTNGNAEFVNAKEKPITFVGGNSKSGIDFVYIQKLADPTEEELAAADSADQAAAALAEAKAAFQADITAAKAIDTIGKNGAAELAAAITAAETAYAAENATVESLTNAKNALAEAVAAFEEANKPAFDPATAIVNAGFNPEADPLGWDKVTSAQFYDLGMGLIGTYQVRGEHPAATVDETHLATEFAAGLECRWSTNYAVFTQTTAELPAGSYKLTFDVENTNATTTKANYENRFNVTVGETTYADESTEWMDGKSAWTTHTIAFTLTEASPITISLGYGTGSNNFGVGNTPALFVSHLTLEAINSIEIALIDLQAAIEAAQAKAATYTVGTEFFTYAESEIKPLNDAIATAQAAYTAAESAEAVKSATETLNAFVATFAPVMNKPAADKEYVITNKNAELALSIGNEAVKIETEGVVKFTEVEGGWVLSNNLETPEYVFKTTGNTWTLSTTANKDEAYVVNFNLADGAYTIQGANGLFGTDNTAEGSAVYANKAQSNNGLWTIAEYVAPEPVKTDYTEYIVNADLTAAEIGWNAEGTKTSDYKEGAGIVKVGSAAAFDFKQTIANLPAGQYKVTAQAAYRYGADETAEAAAIAAETDTKLVQLYATVGEKTVSAKVQNRYDGASETDYANGDGSVTVNEKFVPNSSNAVKAWFAAGQYVNEVIFNLPADGAVTIGINRTGTPESDYTVIGPWTLTRLGDAEVEPEPTPEPGTDMTAKIVNPSFEDGTTGWTYEPSNDHGAKENSNATYTMSNCDGDHMFNIWSSGNAISQKVVNLPNGTYKMKAVIATDANQKVQLNANDKSVQIEAVGKETGVEGELEFNVLDNTATIGAEGVNKYWYKVDNFRLTYVKGFDTAELVTAYETALAEAQAIEGDMNADVKTALDAAISTEVDKTNADALTSATAALTAATSAAKASVAAFAKAKEILPKMKELVDATNVYTAEAYENYYSKWVAKLDEKTLTAEEGNALQDPFIVTGWHANITVDNFLLSAWDTNPDFQDAPYYINSWSVEGESDGSNFKVPFFEYWTGDANSLGERTLTATMNGLEAGDYDVTAWVRVRTKNEAGADAEAYGITLSANEGEATDVTKGETKIALNNNNNFYLQEFTARGSVAEDGVLKIQFNVAEDNNISWLSFKNVKFEKKPAPVVPIDGINYSWESPEGDPMQWGGTIAYVNGDGERLNYLNSGYYTICLNGKKANLPDTVASANAGKMVITLDKPLHAGDTIAYTAYLNKNTSKEASAYILFENGTAVEGEVFGDEANIDAAFNGVPTLKYTIVPAEAAGSKTITLTRSKTGTNLFITKLQVIATQLELTLDVERYPGMGYDAQEATVDFARAKAYLGVEEITTDMLRIVNPNDSLISDYAPYDGWFNGEGAAETWGANTKVCVKFFQAISEGKFEICDMNGADSIGAVYTTKWALVANEKQVTYTINVKFVEKPVIALTFADLNKVDEQTVALTSELGKVYEGLTADVDIAAILAKLEVASLNDVKIYAVQSDGSLDDNYKLGTTDGWRNAAGDWQSWGDDAYFCVKADFAAAEKQIYWAGGMDGKNTAKDWENPATYTATYAFVKAGSADAVVLKVTLTYTVPTGINAIARDAQNADIYNINGQKVNKAQKGLYIINGKKTVVK